MKVFKTKKELNLYFKEFRSKNAKIGFVPTMGLQGLYPLLESVFGPNSQDPENADTRFLDFINGHSQIGTQFGEAFNLLRQKSPGEVSGQLSRSVVSLRPTNTKKPKLQNLVF